MLVAAVNTLLLWVQALQLCPKHVPAVGHFAQFDDADVMAISAVSNKKSVSTPSSFTSSSHVGVWFAQAKAQVTTKGVSSSLTN